MRAALILSLTLLAACGGGGGEETVSFLASRTPSAVRLVTGSNSTQVIQPLDDGTTIVAGRVSSSSAGFVDPSGATLATKLSGEQFLLCYDGAGELLWHRSYDGATDFRWLDIEPTPDGNLIALGVTTEAVSFGSLTVSLGQYPITYFVLRLTRAGEPISIRSHIHTVEPNGGGPAGELAVDPSDGSYVILVQTGRRFHIDPTANVLASEILTKAILKYDAAGELQWRVFGTFLDLGFMEMLSDGDILVGGEFREDGFFRDSFEEETAALVRLIGENGQLRSSIQLGARFNMEAFVECADGYAVAGRTDGALTIGDATVTPGGGSVVLRITGANTLAWSRTEDEGVSYGSLARNPEDASIVAAGGFREPFRGRDPGDRQDGVMTAFDDATGERIWLETVPGPEWLSVSKVWFAPNGDFAISGQASGPNNLQFPGAELNFDADDVLYMLRMR